MNSFLQVINLIFPIGKKFFFYHSFFYKHPTSWKSMIT